MTDPQPFTTSRILSGTITGALAANTDPLTGAVYWWSTQITLDDGGAVVFVQLDRRPRLGERVELLAALPVFTDPDEPHLGEPHCGATEGTRRCTREPGHFTKHYDHDARVTFDVEGEDPRPVKP